MSNFLLDEADSFMAKKFRNRFRLPYPSYEDLLHQIKSDNRFERWRGHKWNGKKSSPVELLLLGSLGYLGRGSQGSRVKKSQHSYYLPRDSWPSSVSLKYIILHQLPNPPPARNPNYQGSRCLTLTSGQPVYHNVGAKINCGSLQSEPRSTVVVSTHPTTTPQLTS